MRKPDYENGTNIVLHFRGCVIPIDITDLYGEDVWERVNGISEEINNLSHSGWRSSTQFLSVDPVVNVLRKRDERIAPRVEEIKDMLIQPIDEITQGHNPIYEAYELHPPKSSKIVIPAEKYDETIANLKQILEKIFINAGNRNIHISSKSMYHYNGSYTTSFYREGKTLYLSTRHSDCDYYTTIKFKQVSLPPCEPSFF
jgi:hypothetical protein